MQINLTFDQVSTMPAGYVADVEYVAHLFDALFSNNVTINLDIGFGEVRGVPVNTDYIGEPSPAQYYTESYAATRQALVAEGAPGSSGLPVSSPLPGSLRLSQAQAKALGFATAGGIDGYVGLSRLSPWSYAIPGQPSTGTILPFQDDAVALLEHEITEVMGRRSDIGGELEYSNGQIFYGVGEPTYYALMDLYRYRAAGVIDTSSGEKLGYPYFSLDQGVSNLGTFNSRDDLVDYGDWYPNGPTANGNDAFNGYPKEGETLPFSKSDLSLMEAIGWSSNNQSADIDVDTADDLAALTSAQIATLASQGFTGLSATDNSIRFTPDQSAAIQAAGMTVSAPANDLAKESFADGSSSIWVFNADDAISLVKTTDADGSFERDRENVVGAFYTAFQGDFTSAASLLARSFDLADGTGRLRIFGNGLQIDAAAGTLGLSGDPNEFTYNPHRSEGFVFLAGSSDDIVNMASGFGDDFVIGFAGGAANNVVNVSALFGSFAAAQAAMTQVGPNTVLTDAQGDTIRFVGVTAGSLTAAQLGFA